VTEPPSAASPRVVALVPARSGSRRIQGKNVRPLAGHPLLAYTIAAARASGVFDAVVLSTDDDKYAEIGRHYGAEVPFLRPKELAGDLSPDVDWIDYTLRRLAELGRPYDAFAILRPTSPFRLPETVRRAWDTFRAAAGADSLRAVEPCTQHPGKMWRVLGDRLVPVLPVQPEGVPWHSSPTQSLPRVWVQNASLEIAWSRCVLEGGSIAGEAIVPFFTSGAEGVDINDEHDWSYVQHLLADSSATLPVVDVEPLRAGSVAGREDEESVHRG
jgi:CMP-N,N'-diacetyllegionaminic acid synthase